MARKKVYVSSTFKDLEEHRSAVKATLERAGFDVECMEKYPAFDERPKDKCLADVAECDYYVLILAWRYGFQPEDDNPRRLSITHLEYEEAVRLQKPCLPFLLDPDAPWKRGFQDPDSHSPDSAICRFRDHVEKRHGRSFYTTPDSLARAIHEALRAGGAEAPERRREGQGANPRELPGLAPGQLRKRRASGAGPQGQPERPPRPGSMCRPSPRGRPESGKRTSLREERHTLLLHRLGDGSLYVPGAPGSGKSTFCRWLALLAAGGTLPDHPIPAPEGFRETLPDALRARFPLLCRLREWAGREEGLSGKGHWTRAQLEESLSGWLDHTRPGGLTAAVFREALADGRCLLILDGVDEVPETLPGGHLPRRNFITGLTDALPEWLKRGNRVLLTSRPYGLSRRDRRGLGLTGAELAELPDELQDTFVRRWYAAANPQRAGEKAEGLLRHLAEREDLAELRRNPMLLTALCVMWDQGQKLPQDFYRLYDAVTGQVLYKRYSTENERDRARFRLEAVALGMHRGLSAERITPDPEVDIDEIDRHLAAYSQSDVVTESGAADAAGRREDLLSNSGLLLPRDGGRAAFYHLSFQEFLAAVRLRRIGDKPEDLLPRHAATPAWRRTLRFLFCAIADKDSPEAAIAGFESLRDHLEPARLQRDPNPALLFADCLEVAHGRRWNLERFAEPLRRACEHALEHLNPPERAQLWRTLGRLGLDHRPGVGLRDGLPDIDWVEVPAGAFLFGEEKERTTLPAFRIARYPVTNAQYQTFIDDGGYQTDAWWEGLAERPEPARGIWTDPNAPRETVSWYEAMAYSRWLDARLREKGTPAGRPSRAAAHRGRVGESGPRPRRPRFPGAVRLEARRCRRNRTRRPLISGKPPPSVSTRPALPPAARWIWSGMSGNGASTNTRIPSAEVREGMLGGWCAAVPGTTPRRRALCLPPRRLARPPRVDLGLRLVCRLPSPEPLGHWGL